MPLGRRPSSSHCKVNNLDPMADQPRVCLVQIPGASVGVCGYSGSTPQTIAAQPRPLESAWETNSHPISARIFLKSLMMFLNALYGSDRSLNTDGVSGSGCFWGGGYDRQRTCVKKVMSHVHFTVLMMCCCHGYPALYERNRRFRHLL